MFDVGWSELLLIGIVALIVVGPKDLPHLFHAFGRFTAKARSMAREFTSAMDDAAKSAGMDEAAKSLREIQSMTSKRSLGLDALDRAADRFEKWDPKVPGSSGGAQPDPAAPSVQPVEEVAPAAPAAPAPAAAGGVEPEPATALAAEETPATGTRRLHAVRRSDRKDD